MKANSKDLRTNTEKAITFIIEELFNQFEGTAGMKYTNADSVKSQIMDVINNGFNVMFHIGYERGAEDLKETIFKPEV